MKWLSIVSDHCIACRVDGDEGRRIPGGVLCPPRQVWFPCMLVERMLSLEVGVVGIGMSRCWAGTAAPVLVVRGDVPARLGFGRDVSLSGGWESVDEEQSVPRKAGCGLAKALSSLREA